MCYVDTLSRYLAYLQLAARICLFILYDFISVLSAGVNRHELFNVWRNVEESSRFDAVFCYISNRSDLKDYDEVAGVRIRKTLRNFCGQLALKWKECNRTLKIFICA